ncbi:MAG TPA: ATP-binding protein [Anaerolineales bacterium]|jgi:signal transduction histidine kinase
MAQPDPGIPPPPKTPRPQGLRGSLLAKLLLAFWVVSVMGIVIVGLLAGRVSTVEFNRFVSEIRFQRTVDQLSTYYTDHGTFTGAGYLLAEARTSSGREAREFLVVDPQGKVLIALAQRIPPGMPSPDIIRFGFPIVAQNRVTAYLIPLRTPRTPAESVSENLQRINLTLFIGVIAATLVALLFGWFLARNIIRPLRDLNAATQSIARGDLEKQVKITTRDEIGTLADSFNQMVDSLKRSRDLRRQMTADIAHELRNPLSIILGNAEALSDGVLPATPEALGIIYDEAKHLSHLVDDLRTLSLSESGELHLHRNPASPRELIQRCASANILRATESGISIRAESAPDLPDVDVDFERIAQVLANLVDNSLKHTPQGGSIVLSASRSGTSARPQDETAVNARNSGPDMPAEAVIISVEDSGSGIRAEDLPFVFDRFYRGKTTAGRIHDGSGLGLAISRALVELHGGKIFAESQVGQGTRISIFLPTAGA